LIIVDNSNYRPLIITNNCFNRNLIVINHHFTIINNRYEKMWETHCHKPAMTGNGLYVPAIYGQIGIGLLFVVPTLLLTNHN